MRTTASNEMILVVRQDSRTTSFIRDHVVLGAGPNSTQLQEHCKSSCCSLHERYCHTFYTETCL